MRKNLFKLSVLFVSLFVGIITTNAKIDVVGTNCKFESLESTNATCDLQLAITGGSTITSGTEYNIKLHSPSNIKDNKVTIVAATGWTVDGGASKEVTLSESNEVVVKFVYTGADTLSDATIKFGEGQYVKNDASLHNCGFKYGFAAGTCRIIDNQYYYNTNGEYMNNKYETIEEVQTAFYKECYVCKPKSEADDDKWHGTEGKIVEEDEYYQQCFSCKVDGDKYYNKAGREVTKEEALKDCYSCVVDDDGTYHDANGQVTTEEGYKKDCEKTCRAEKIDGKWHYYDYDDNEVTKEQYENICQRNAPTGSFIPYVGIGAGIILIGTAAIMVKKQSKLRNL